MQFENASQVIIRGLEVEACHGVYGFEKENSQKFIFDADLCVDFFAAAKNDCLDNTVSYSSVCNLIIKIATQNTFNLIEKLAYECARQILEIFAAQSVRLTVYKPQAPVKHKFKTVGVTVELKRERAYLSLGSSEGDRKSFLDEAVKKLDKTEGVKVKKVSSYIKTTPYGGVAQNEFLNCAVEIETYLPPHVLLDEIHRIENECGRVRKKCWDDRTLDIDIIFYGNEIIRTEDLTIPHAEYAVRDFVLIPLKEIAPDFVCPVLNKRVKDI